MSKLFVEPIDWCYEKPERTRAYRIGFRYAMKCAAYLLESHHAKSSSGYRMADILLMKFNQTKRKNPRKAK